MLYIDNARNPYGNMVMCHMIADTNEELVEAAQKLGLKPEWIQKEGTAQEHFDVSAAIKQKAIRELGARAISKREIIRIIQGKRDRIRSEGK